MIFLDKLGNPMSLQQMQPSNSMLISAADIGDDGEPTELTKMDISNKSIEQLKAMGFTSVYDNSVNQTARNRNMEPEMPPEAIERMEKALQGMAVLKSGISGRQ